MPGTPEPVGSAGGLNPWWNSILSAMRASTRTDAAIIAGRQQTNTVDQYGNTLIVVGQLNQQVTIGAAFQKPGVQVTTGITSGQGQAVQQNLALGTITTTKGSTAATLNSTASGTFSNGMLIGAANVSDPSSGVATPAIVPGTTFTISGSAVTLSQPAAESGTGLYCAACTWKQQTSF